MERRSIAVEEPLLSEGYSLGSLVKTYQTQVTRSGKLIFWMFVAFILLLIGGMVALFLCLYLPNMNDPFFLSPSFLLPSVGLPALALPFVIFISFWQFRSHELLVTPVRRKIVVTLHTGGFRYREGRKQQIVRWEQIDFVTWLMIKRWSTPVRYYKVRLRDATEITLPGVIAGVQELGAAIESEMVKQLLPEVLARYAANKPVVFTGLCLNQEGISKSDETLPWQAVEHIALGLEKLTIKEVGRTKPWLAVHVAQLRNMCVLEGLLENIRKEKNLTIDYPVFPAPKKSRNKRIRKQQREEGVNFYGAR